MSIFKTKWFIIKKKIIEKNEIITFFSYDYWKIIFSKKVNKKEKNLDIGYIINIEIKTNEWKDIHLWNNIKIVNELNYQSVDFSTLNSYLELINQIDKNIPLNLQVIEIYEIIDSLNKTNNLNFTKLLLSKLKVLNILWLLNVNHKNITINKILKFIQTNKIEKILLLTWLDDYLTIELNNIITWNFN